MIPQIKVLLSVLIHLRQVSLKWYFHKMGVPFWIFAKWTGFYDHLQRGFGWTLWQCMVTIKHCRLVGERLGLGHEIYKIQRPRQTSKLECPWSSTPIKWNFQKYKRNINNFYLFLKILTLAKLFQVLNYISIIDISSLWYNLTILAIFFGNCW